MNGIVLIEEFDRTIARFESAKGKTRVALTGNVREMVGLAVAEIGTVERWLKKSDAWFDDNQNHPKFEERSDHWIARMFFYERLYGMIQRALDAIGEDEQVKTRIYTTLGMLSCQSA